MVLVLLASTGALVGAGPPPGRPTPGEAAFAPGRILVKFRPGVGAAQKAAAHRAQGAGVLEVIPGIDVQVVNVPKGAETAKVAAYARNPLVAYAEPDYIAYALEDPLFSKQWGLDNTGQVYKEDEYGNPVSGTPDADIDAPEAWGIATGDPEIKIAILDTGIDQDHPDLVGKLVAADNVNLTNSRTVDDLYGHGTHVAGIAAAETDNGEGVAGVGYNCSLLNVKVLNDRGSGRYSWIAYGIIWAADSDAQVINMSLGGYSYSDTLEDAVNYAWNKGVVLAAAAGNDGISDKLYPAAYANCIAVAATDDDDQRVDEPGWWASNYGTWVDVAAPGLYIYSTIPNHDSRIWGMPDETPYDYGSGTSMATPHVAGLAALVWAQGYTSNVDVRNQIQSTADPIDGTDTYWIYGRINACNAVGGSCTYGPPPPPATGSITGKVTHASTSAAIEGATVVVEGTGQSATTAADGTYTIADVPTGDRSVTASAEGFVAQTKTAGVTEGQPTTVDFALDPIPVGSITGKVTNAVGGTSIAGATVLVEDTGQSAITAADGTYTITDVPTGDRSVTASADGFESQPKMVPVNEGQTTTANFALNPVTTADKVSVDSISYATEGGRNNDKHLNITVALVDNLGNDVVGASVSIDVNIDESLYTSGTGTTETEGKVTFKLPNAPSGRYTTKVIGVTADGLTWVGGTPENWFDKQ